ncbi:MAG: thioredoxin-related protein [Sulfurimonas sp.]|jgi:thioredoxin-related protein
MFKLLFKTFLLILFTQTLLFSREINIDNIIKKAASSNKHLLVWLHKTDCPYCGRMQKLTLNTDLVKSLIEKKFIFIHIDIYDKDEVTYKDFKGNGRSFAKFMGYDFYPTSLFYDNNKELIYAVPGYQNKKIYSEILEYIDSKSYHTMEFEEFKNELDFKEEL